MGLDRQRCLDGGWRNSVAVVIHTSLSGKDNGQDSESIDEVLDIESDGRLRLYRLSIRNADSTSFHHLWIGGESSFMNYIKILFAVKLDIMRHLAVPIYFHQQRSAIHYLCGCNW